MDEFSLLGKILDENGISDAYLFKFKRRLEKALSINELRVCIDVSPELEELSFHQKIPSKSVWYNWFPKYMCDEANSFLTEENSSLVSILSETVVSKQVTNSWRGDKLGDQLLYITNCSLPNECSVTLFYILFVIIVNLPTLRDTYFFMEEKPKFLFEFFYSSGVFDSTHPIYHILEKLIQVDKENEKRCQAESTFDWDLFLVNLLIKLTFLSLYHSSKETPSSYLGISASPIVLQLLYYSLLALVHQQDGSQQSSYNLVYMYCFTTLLAINLPSCPLEMNTVSFTPFFLGKRCSNQTFLGQVLSLMIYLLYGDVHAGFYPVKAMAGESRITTQLRCACLHVWEVSLTAYFKTNSVYETLKHVIELENSYIKKNHYSYWLNALINRMCRYVSSHIRDLLSYPCFTEAKIHKEILSTIEAGIELSSQEIMDRFVLKKRDEIANYIQDYLIPIVLILTTNTSILFTHTMSEGERERFTRQLIFSQFSIQCDEHNNMDYHYCLERDFFKKEFILTIYRISWSLYKQKAQAITGTSLSIPIDYFRSSCIIQRNSQSITSLSCKGRFSLIWLKQCFSPADGIFQFHLKYSSASNHRIIVGISLSRSIEDEFVSSFSDEGEKKKYFPVSIEITERNIVSPLTNEITVYLDMLSGYLWSVNDKGELIDSVVTGLPLQSVYIGIMIENEHFDDTTQLFLSQVTPKEVNQTDCSFVHYMNDLLMKLLRNEIHSFELSLQSREKENQLRFYCKQMKYIITYYSLLQLHRFISLTTLPFPIIDLLQQDLLLRQQLLQFYPSLFITDKEQIEGYHEYSTVVRFFSFTEKEICPSDYQTMNDSSNMDTASPLSPIENDYTIKTFLQQVKSIHSLAIHFDKEILVNSNNGLRFIGKQQPNCYYLHSLNNQLLLILFRSSAQSLYGLLFDYSSLQVCGFMKCEEKECFKGLQGLRSPTLFLHSLQFLYQFLLQQQLTHYTLLCQKYPSFFSSALFRNGLCEDSLTPVIAGQQEKVLSLLQQIESFRDKESIETVESLASEVRGRKYYLDLPDTEYENQLYQQVKLPKICQPSYPHHIQVLVYYRLLMNILAYHTNQSHLLLPCQNGLGEIMISKEICDFYKEGSQLLVSINSIRTKKNQSWEDLQFIQSYTVLVEDIHSAGITMRECKEILLDCITNQIDCSNLLDIVFSLEKAAKQTVLACSYLLSANSLPISSSSIHLHSSSYLSSYLLSFISSSLASNQLISLYSTLLISYCTNDLLSFILYTIHSFQFSQLSSSSILTLLQLFYTISLNHHTLYLTMDQMNNLRDDTLQLILILLQTQNDFAILSGVPYLSRILLCYPMLSYSNQYLTQLLSIMEYPCSMIQLSIAVIFHFIFNNWTSVDSSLSDVLSSILTKLSVSCISKEDSYQTLHSTLITTILQEENESPYQVYMYDYLFLLLSHSNQLLYQYQTTTLPLLISSLFINPYTHTIIQELALSTFTHLLTDQATLPISCILPSSSFFLSDIQISEELWNSMIQVYIRTQDYSLYLFIISFLQSHSVTATSIPYSFFLHPSSFSLFQQFIAILSSIEPSSSLFHSAEQTLGFLLNEWCLIDPHLNCFQLFQHVEKSVWYYSYLLKENASVIQYLHQYGSIQDWQEVFQYCQQTHCDFAFVKRIIEVFISTSITDITSFDTSLLLSLLQDYSSLSIDYLNLILNILSSQPILLQSFDLSSLLQQGQQALSSLHYHSPSSIEQLLLQLILQVKLISYQPSLYAIPFELGRTPYGYQILTEHSLIFSFNYNRNKGLITLIPYSYDDLLFILDYRGTTQYYYLDEQEDGVYVSGSDLLCYYHWNDSVMNVELKLENELMDFQAKHLKVCWNELLTTVSQLPHKQQETISLDSIADGCFFSFTVHIGSYINSPFIVTLSSNHHSQLVYLPLGSISFNKRVIAYGEAAEVNDSFTIVLDEPRSTFSVFLEGKRLGYDYVEDFGEPAWGDHSFKLRTNEPLERTLSVHKKEDLSSHFTCMREVDTNEIMEQITWFVYSIQSFLHHHLLPSSYLSYCYTQSCKWASNHYKFFPSRIPFTFILLNTDPAKLQSLYPSLSLNQVITNPYTGCTVRIVGLLNSSIYYQSINTNLFESNREEFSYVEEMDQQWTSSYITGPSSSYEEFHWDISLEEYKENLQQESSIDLDLIYCINRISMEKGVISWNIPISSIPIDSYLSSYSSSFLYSRIAFLYSLNLQLLYLLPYLSSSSSSWSFIQLIKPYLFTTTKSLLHSFSIQCQHQSIEPSFDTQYLPTSFPTFHFNQLLSRKDHLLQLASLEKRFTQSVTYQFIQQIKNFTEADYHHYYIHHSTGGQKRLFHVVFDGEGGLDNGGLYRDLFHTVLQELTDISILPFFTHTTNYKNNHGNDDLLLNERLPLSFLPYLREIGRIIGIAVISDIQLELYFSPVIWKLLNHEKIQKEHLACVDRGFYQHLIDLLSCEKDSFEEVKWIGYTSQGEVLYHPHHSPFARVEYNDREEYVNWLIELYLSKQREYIELIREGMISVDNFFETGFLTGDELKLLVVGKNDFDIVNLHEHTKYEGYNESDMIIQWFWEVLEEMTCSQRTLFLQFTTARSRLPMTSGCCFNFQITRIKNRENMDCYYPVAHTCFNGLDLPAYSTKKILKERLIYAISNTIAIDGDTLQHTDITWDS